MPYCSQCGNQVAERDVYCARCGTRQPVQAVPAPRPGDPLAHVSPRTASILCYVPGIGWIASIIVLAAEKFRENRKVRFDAFQGLYLFVAWLIEDWVMRPVFHGIPHMHFDSVVKAVLLAASIFMIIKASNEQTYALPIIGELAERSVAEQ
jgi:uncharacterized membrane protein